MADATTPERGIMLIGPGLYLVRARATDPRTGRERAMKRKVTARNIEEAIARREEMAEEIRGGGRRPVERPRLGPFALSWLERRSVHVRPSTLERYGDGVAQAVARWGEWYIDQLRPGDVEDWQAARRRDGYSPATINGWLRVLRAMGQAAERDLGVPDFTRGVKSLREGRTRGARAVCLRPDELQRLLDSLHQLGPREAGQDVVRAVEALAWTGLRCGELLALRWSDIDDDELVIERAVWRRIAGPTKTDDPRRVAIVEPLAELLEVQRRWLLEQQHAGLASGLMFPASERHAKAGATRRGSAEVSWYRARTSLSRVLAKAATRAGLPRLSPHALRRSFEDTMRRAGVQDLVRRSACGWRSSTAQGIYATVGADERAVAGAAMVELVIGGKK